MIYRLRNGFDDRQVQMAVVVQRMVFPQAAGLLFTADPVTSDRKVVSIEASFGLGEALVAGLVNPDVYRVRGDAVVARTVGAKRLAIYALPDGGTEERAVAADRREEQALTDAQVVRLARLGRRIEAHFGRPQDIEWCLADDEFQIVQSRPITTLFPIPATDDDDNHVYISVGHQQMMTDAMKPLGLSDVAADDPAADGRGRRAAVRRRHPDARLPRQPRGPGDGHGAIRSADRGRVADRPRAGRLSSRSSRTQDQAEMPVGSEPATIETDPAIVSELVERGQASIAALRRDIGSKSGPELFDFILADLPELRRTLFDPRGLQVILAGMQASWRLNEQLETWLGEKNAVDTLTQSVPGNVTSEMGLALLDVADVIRPHPEVVAFLEQVSDEGFLDELPALAGGREARAAIGAFLDQYGMRCVGEIDITRPRWSERPSTLVPLILGNIRNFEPGAGPRLFEEGLRKAEAKEQDVLTRLRALPDGELKAEEAKRLIDRIRTFSGYREYPKYGMVSRYFVYKLALLAEADRQVQAGLLEDREDIFFLTFQEFHAAVRTSRMDDRLIAERKDAFRSYQALTPPRVLTSDGEAVAGTYRRDDLPAGALTGLPVSAGTVEGRARVILDLADADLVAGDILVTAYTDPSWTPAFVTITRPGDRGGRPDDARRGHRPGVRPARRRRGAAGHPADQGRTADPGERDGRLHRDPRLATAGRRASEPEAGQAARLLRQAHDRRSWLQAVHVPRRRSLRWRVERGGDARPAGVGLGRPAVVGPRLRDPRQRVRLGHPGGVALEDDVSVADRHRDRAARIALDVASLAGAFAGLEPERAIEPEGADRGHMRAAVLVDRGQPRRAGVERVRGRGGPGIELGGDGRPVNGRQAIGLTQILDLHTDETCGGRVSHRAYAGHGGIGLLDGRGPRGDQSGGA